MGRGEEREQSTSAKEKNTQGACRRKHGIGKEGEEEEEKGRGRREEVVGVRKEYKDWREELSPEATPEGRQTMEGLVDQKEDLVFSQTAIGSH